MTIRGISTALAIGGMLVALLGASLYADLTGLEYTFDGFRASELIQLLAVAGLASFLLSLTPHGGWMFWLGAIVAAALVLAAPIEINSLGPCFGYADPANSEPGCIAISEGFTKAEATRALAIAWAGAGVSVAGVLLRLWGARAAQLREVSA